MDVSQRTVKELIKQFTGQAQVLAIPRPFIKLTGDHICALVLNQIIYWSERTENEEGWFYKTAGDWGEELCISAYQLTRAIESLKKFGVEKKVKKIGAAPVLHFRINFDYFCQLFTEYLESEETSLSRSPIIKKLDNQETSLSDAKETRKSESEVSSQSSIEAKITTETTPKDIPQRAEILLNLYSSIVRDIGKLHLHTKRNWKTLIENRLREGWTDEQIELAWKGCKLDQWKMTKGFNGVPDILTNRDETERLIELGRNGIPERSSENGNGQGRRESTGKRPPGAHQQPDGAHQGDDRKWAAKNRI
jgi:hypothetical protein